MTDTASAATERDGLGIAHRLLVTVAVLALVGTVLGLVLVQRIGTTYRDGLQVAADGADVAAISVSEAGDVVDEVAGLTSAVSTALDEAEVVLRSAADSLDQIGVAMDDNIAEGIEASAEIANGLAGFIETIERFIPGDSDSLAESLRKLSDGLEPTPEQLRTLAEQLATTADELRATADSIDPISVQVDALGTDLTSSQKTLDQVDDLARQVQASAQSALDRSSTDLWLLRLLTVVLGVGTAAACWAASRAVRSLAQS